MSGASAERELVARGALYVLAAAAAYAIVLMAQPFANALGWAAVTVIVFHPVHLKIEHRLGPVKAASISTAAVTVIVIVPVVLLATVFVREAVQAVAALQQAYVDGRLAWVDRGWTWVQQRSIGSTKVDLAAAAMDAVRQLAAIAAAQGGAILQNVALSIVDLVITLFTTFFLFRDGRALMDFIRRALPIEPRFRERLIGQVAEVVSATVTSSGVIAGLQGLLGGLLFAVLGLSAPVFWGVVMAFLCLLPFGAWIVWIPASIFLLASGDVVRGLVLAGFGFAVVSAVDNILRPAMLSGRAQMNGLLVFISLIGGVHVFGALGLVLGPTLLATVVGVVRAYLEPEGAAPS